MLKKALALTFSFLFVVSFALLTFTASGTPYSIADAVDYAQAHGTEVYSYHCATFASECLQAGHLPTTSTWYPDSTAWINVNYLRNSLIDRTDCCKTTITNPHEHNLFHVGDYIFIDFINDEELTGCSCTVHCANCTAGDCDHCTSDCSGRHYDHVVICTGKDTDGTTLFCDHSSNTHQIDKRFYISKTSVYYVVRLYATHTAGYNYQYSRLKHWKTCTRCGEKCEESNHTLGLSGNVMVCECGYSTPLINSPAPQEPEIVSDKSYNGISEDLTSAY